MNKENNLQHNPVTPGKRLKALRKERRLTQEELADAIHNLDPNCHCCEKQIGYIENDRRQLKRDLAYLFSRFFNVDVEWIMCSTDYRTSVDRMRTVINIARSEAQLLENAFLSLSEVNGYKVTLNVPDLEDGHKNLTAEQVLNSFKTLYRIEKDGKTMYLSFDKLNAFEIMLCDMANSALKYLFREGESNG